MSRDLVSGDVAAIDLTTPGQAKVVITENDEPGDAGDIPYSQGPGLPWVMGPPPTGVNGGAYFERITATDAAWPKPTGFDPSSRVYARWWGGGGSGGRDVSAGGGGGGGYKERWMLLSDIASTENVVIGAGGAPSTATSLGNPGGNTTFGTHGTAYGGGAGTGSSGSNDAGGGGGGPFSAGSNGGGGVGGAPGAPVIADGVTNQGQGGGANTVGRPAIWHGGGGGARQVGGDSIYGGAGGGGNNSTTGQAGGTSMHGGNGGAAGVNGSSGSSGQSPGGGGGSCEAVGGAQSGAGADGWVEIYIFPPQA